MGYRRTQSTYMCDVVTAAPSFGNQSSWMHRCIGPGGSASFFSVWNQCLPSTKAVTWSGPLDRPVVPLRRVDLTNRVSRRSPDRYARRTVRRSRSVPMAARRSPTAVGVALLGRELGDVDADHRLAQAARDLGDHRGVVEERGGLDDGLGPLSGIAGLEDAG